MAVHLLSGSKHKKSMKLIETSIGTIGTFARTNPIITAGLLATAIGGIGAVATIIKRRSKSVKRKKRKKANTGRRKRGITHNRRGKHIRRATKRRTKRITHRMPRHRGHKVVKFRTKSGKMVSFKTKK